MIDRHHLTVSVIIRVYNGGTGFHCCLSSLMKAVTPSTEIIVVADGNTDGSWLVAENFSEKVIRIPTSGGLAKARNIGARAAIGNILFFVDADVVIYPDTISKVSKAFENQPDLTALIGSYDDAPGSSNFLSQYKKLIVDAPDLFPDNWIYIHSSDVKVGRIQNFKNWSSAMVPDSSKTCLGMEYFCNSGDSVWEMSDAELIDLTTKELDSLGLAKGAVVEDGVVISQPKVYPVYDHEYRQYLQVIQNYLQKFENLQTTGRNGMHRYNNQDRSMLTGLLAAKNILGEYHDLWEVNTERSYYEEFTTKPKKDDRVLAK